MQVTIYIVTAIVGYCSIVYELILAQCLSVVLGNTIARYALTIGLYLFSLGMGSLYLYFRPAKQPLRFLLYAEILLTLIGMLLPALVLVGDHLIFQLFTYFRLNPELFSSLLLHSLVLLVGFVSGLEVPILMQLAVTTEAKSEADTKILGLDYFATFVGAVSFPFFIYQTLGLVAGSAFVALLNAIAALLLLGCLYRSKEFFGVATTLVLTCISLCVVIMVHESSIRSYLIAYVFGGH